jgi:uncharacterized membrane-anchored protein YitT (DUF2179 family)
VLKDVKSYAHLKPGQNGTKRLEVKSRDKNKLAVLLFVVVSLIYVFAWKYFDLPHDTSVEFTVRGISISIISILTTWLILKLIK